MKSAWRNFLDTGTFAAATALVEELRRSGEVDANAMLAMAQQFAAKKTEAIIE